MAVLPFCLDVLIAILSVIGAWISFGIDGWSMFRYYTLCSNLFLLLACSAQAWYEGNILLDRRMFVPGWVRVLKYFAVCTVMVTFSVVMLILIPAGGGVSAMPGYLLRGSTPYHHVICPLLGFASLVFFDRAALPDLRITLWALVPTFAYAVVAGALNLAGVLDGPYFFLRIRSQPVWTSVRWYLVVLVIAWALAWLVWKLALRFSVPREAPPAIPEAHAWTEDGFLKDQNALGAFTYRSIPASANSCGPVAVYNLLHRAGQSVPFPDVLREMDDMHLLRIPGPTFMHVMRRCLRKRLPGWREVHGRSAALAAAECSRMGVFRYHEQRVPHFVAYYRTESGTFRFFNVNDEREDVCLTMADFAAGHLLGGSVRLLFWE